MSSIGEQEESRKDGGRRSGGTNPARTERSPRQTPPVENPPSGREMFPPIRSLPTMYQPETQDEPRAGLDDTQAHATKTDLPEIEPDDADVLDPDPITDVDIEQPITEATADLATDQETD